MFQIELLDLKTLDVSQFIEMYNLCLKQNINPSYLKWKYSDNPAGKAVGYTASVNGILAGFYGVVPQYYIINGQKKIVYQSMDTMTHPSFQKRGLFTLLAEKTYENILDKNSDATIIGIPGSNSYHGFVNKLHWRHVTSFQYIFLNRYLFQLLNSTRENASVQAISDFSDPEFQEFLEIYNKNNSGIKPFMDSEFLSWRIKEHSFKKLHPVFIKLNGKIIGAAIYSITEKNKCFIEWIESNEHGLLRTAVRGFCNYIFNNYKLNYIYTWKPIADNRYAQFISLRFLYNPFNKGPFSYKVPFIIYSRNKHSEWLNTNSYNLQPIIQE